MVLYFPPAVSARIRKQCCYRKHMVIAIKERIKLKIVWNQFGLTLIYFPNLEMLLYNTSQTLI